MTLEHCNYIVEISKHNSISQAASALYMTQPSISKAIKDIEDELNITIFNRSNKGVIFTKEGQELLFYAKMLLEQASELKEHFNKDRDSTVKKIQISSQHYGFAIKALTEWMDALKNEKFEITMHEGKATDVIEDVYSNKSMLGVLLISTANYDFFERYFISKSLVFTPLKTMKQAVFLRKEHPLARYDILTIEQLKVYPYLTYQQDDSLLYRAEKFMDTHSQEQIVYVKDRGTMNALLSHTDGFNIGTGHIVEGFMEDNIVARLLEGETEIHVGFIKRYDHIFSEEIKLYIGFLTEVVSISVKKKEKFRGWLNSRKKESELNFNFFRNFILLTMYIQKSYTFEIVIKEIYEI